LTGFVAVTKQSQSHHSHTGVKLRGIPPDLRSGTSCLRSTTSNNRSCTSQLRSGTFVAVIHHSAHFILEYFSLCLTFCKKNVVQGHFVICICPCLVWIDVASVKPYLNATKAKQSALNARKPTSGTPPLLSVLRARASALQASRL